MRIKIILFSISLLLALISTINSSQVIPDYNYGPPYMYPADPKDRLYKLPFHTGVSTYISGGYGSDPHTSEYLHPDYAIDFDNPNGTEILAVRGGIVAGRNNNLFYGKFINTETICNNPGKEGNTIEICRYDSIPDTLNPGQWKTVITRDMYYHVSHVMYVQPDDTVYQGQLIGHVSCTGLDAGPNPHIHFEVNMAGHKGHFDFDGRPNYTFTSLPVPFVEITKYPNGLGEVTDTYVSQNTLYTEVEEAPSASFNRETIIFKVSPNPFNALTEIEFLLTRPHKLSLDIYSIDGKRITVLARGTFDGKRNYRFRWSSQGVPAGIYLCRLQAEDKVVTKRLLLHK